MKIEIARTSGARSPLPWILLAIILAAFAVAAYFLLMRPATKKVGTITPETQYSAQQIQGANETESMDENYEFDDGLRNPVSQKTLPLDEYGEGVASIDVFQPDINSDGLADTITRTKNENGTAHFYYDYKVQLNTGNELIDITPDGFRTTEGADCALQKLRFVFIPSFQVIKIGRDWQESWATPTMANKTIYKIDGNALKVSSSQAMKKICNVSELF